MVTEQRIKEVIKIHIDSKKDLLNTIDELDNGANIEGTPEWTFRKNLDKDIRLLKRIQYDLIGEY